MCPADAFDETPGAYAARLTHTPVMRDEVLAYLNPQPGAVIVDGTLGGGGHALEICRRIGPTGRLLGIEQDAAALERARKRLEGFPVTYIHDNFRHLDNLLAEFAPGGVDGVLLDLGVSTFQLDTPERGFSFRLEGPLDMRMDPRLAATAADLVNRMEEESLVRLFFASGYGRWARRLAKAVTIARKRSPITTTAEFAAVVTHVLPATHRSKIHPATQAFQALRIAVNDEIAALAAALPAAVHHSNTAARIVVLSYHSLEDGETKRQFHYLSGKRPPPSHPLEMELPPPPALVRILTKKPVTPTPAEVKANPRSRSAKLRAAERI